MRKYLLPEKGNFYKANLHCHSQVSDGAYTALELKELYMKEGYSIIAYTDHSLLIPHHKELSDENFLALNGFEWDVGESGKAPGRNKCLHICLIALEEDNFIAPCWNREEIRNLKGNGEKYRDLVKFDESLPDFEKEYTAECINKAIKNARNTGFFVTYNHPVWSQEDYSNYMSYENMNAMEICNYACIAEGWYDYNPKIYDDILRSGKKIYAIAADDNHNFGGNLYDSFGGYTVIKAEKLQYRTITKALEEGNFYASQGPEIRALWYENGKIHIECSDAEYIDFNFGIMHAKRFRAEKNGVINMAECEVPPHSVYVRVTVWDKYGKPADTNAYFVEDLNKE